MTEKTIIVYHNTQALARRSRPPQAGETISYAAKTDWDVKENDRFDEVVDLSDKVEKKTLTKREEL